MADRGRWETTTGAGELAQVDRASLPLGAELDVLLPDEEGERLWRCRVEGEQLDLLGGTTLVVRAISEAS